MLLPYGRHPYRLDLAGRAAWVVAPPALPAPAPVDILLEQALAAPIGRPALPDLVREGARITVVVSDPTRNEPRSQFLVALARHLPDVHWTLAIATGTHGPAKLGDLGIPADVLARTTVVNHDGHTERDLVSLGETPAGTPMHVHRCAVETDLVIATGCIRPHYFAGFGAGVKAIFPGLGHAPAIRANHRLKLAPLARAGIVDENPCRLDLEAAVALLPSPTFLLNGVCGPDGLIHAAVAGDPVVAFRKGVALARPWFTVAAPRSSLVIASDALPITATLYQSAKIASAAAPLVADGGALVVVAECADGTGPLDTVNEAIFRIGVLPRLPPDASLHLVSEIPDAIVAQTLLRSFRSWDDLLAHAGDPIVVIPHASSLLLEATS